MCAAARHLRGALIQKLTFVFLAAASRCSLRRRLIFPAEENLRCMMSLAGVKKVFHGREPHQPAVPEQREAAS